MKNKLSAVNIFAVVIGLFLLAEGIWGLFSPVVFGVLSTNILHACIHLLLGINAIYWGTRNQARKFILFVGVLLTLVGILFFIPGADALVIEIFNVNRNVAVLNIVMGIPAILFALLTPKKAVSHPAESHPQHTS